MKRDMDLVRKILLAVEEQGEHPQNWIENFAIDGYEDETVAYHVWMLAQAGFIEAIDLSVSEEFCWGPRCLTWAGHEFLDTVRDPELWEQTKAGARKVGSFSIEVLAALAKGLVKKKIAQHTGVELDL